MSLYTVSSGAPINSQDVNQLVLSLQQGSGGQEVGFFNITFSASTVGYFGSGWIRSISNGSTPVSVSLTGISTTNCGSVLAVITSSSGFQASAQCTNINANIHFSANYVIQY